MQQLKTNIEANQWNRSPDVRWRWINTSANSGKFVTLANILPSIYGSIATSEHLLCKKTIYPASVKQAEKSTEKGECGLDRQDGGAPVGLATLVWCCVSFALVLARCTSLLIAYVFKKELMQINGGDMLMGVVYSAGFTKIMLLV